MVLDAAALATTVVVKVLLPYVKKGVGAIAKEVAEEHGDSVAKYATDVAEKAWNRVKAAFSSDSDKATLEQFEEYGEPAQPLVQAILEKKLQQDELLAKDLSALVDTPGPGGLGTGAQIIGATYAGVVDMRNAHFSGNDAEIVGLRVGEPSPPRRGVSPTPAPPAPERE